MKLHPLVCALVVGCTPSMAPPPEPIAARREALQVMLVGLGPQYSALGKVLTSCNGEFIASGGTVGNVFWSQNLGVFSQSPPANIAISCDGLAYQATSSSQWFTATSSSSGWSPINQVSFPNQGVDVIEREGGTGSSRVILSSSGAFLEEPSTFGLLKLPDAGAVAWQLSGGAFALLQADGTIRLYSSLGVAAGFAVQKPLGRTFNGAMALGDFVPTRVGLELAAGLVNGDVLLADFGGSALRMLDGGASFGASLATVAIVPGVDALLIGEPTLDRVWRMVGDELTVVLTMDAGTSDFGYRISTANGGGETNIAISAPRYAARGGVFVGSETLRTGEPQACTSGRMCPFDGSCAYGVCLGGVACVDRMSGCLGGGACVNNQCVPGDGGSGMGGGGGSASGGGGGFVTGGGSSTGGGTTMGGGPAGGGTSVGGGTAMGGGPAGGGASVGGGSAMGGGSSVGGGAAVGGGPAGGGSSVGGGAAMGGGPSGGGSSVGGGAAVGGGPGGGGFVTGGGSGSATGGGAADDAGVPNVPTEFSAVACTAAPGELLMLALVWLRVVGRRSRATSRPRT